MAKKQPKTLTEPEIFYVEQKSKDGMTPDEIASVLSCTVDDIVSYLYKGPSQPTQTYKAFQTQSNGGRPGVVVMTPNASMMGDELKHIDPRDTSRFITTTKK